MRKAIALLALGACAVRATDYSAVLDSLFVQSDSDNDNLLDSDEFKVALDKLGIPCDTFTLHAKSCDNFFSAVDTDGNQKISTKEMSSAIKPEWKEYEDPLKSAFTNGAGKVPTKLPVPSEAFRAAVATVTAEVTVAGSPSSIYPGQRRDIIDYFADLAGVTVDEVVCTFTKKKKGGQGRRLASDGETLVDAKMFLASDAAAAAAARKMPKTSEAMGAVPAFSGLTVTETKIFTVPEWQVPFASLAGMAVALVFGGFFTCWIAKCWARRNREIQRRQYDGCCSTGCCSFLAVKSWAFWQLFACALLLAMVIFLMLRMQILTNALVKLLDLFLALVKSTVAFISQFQRQVPTTIVNTVEQYRHLVPLLPVAVIVPGVLSCLCLLFSGACPMGKCHVGKYGCTKCLIMLGNGFLLVSMVFYMIFAVFAVGIKYAPPQLRSQINSITQMCELVPAMIVQAETDNSAALDMLKAQGQDVSAYEASFAPIRVLKDNVDGACTQILIMFESFNLLFLPGICCVIAIVFALYVNNSLCCAAGCCGQDNYKIEQMEKAEKGVEFTNVATKSNVEGFSSAP